MKITPEWLAVGISVVALVASYLTNRRLVRLEEARDRRAEEAQRLLETTADIWVELTSDWKIGVGNYGRSSAKDIQIQVEGRSLQEHPIWIKDQKLATTMHAGDSLAYHMGHRDGIDWPLEGLVSWEDGSGSRTKGITLGRRA